MHHRHLEVSVVIPCLNEARSIAICIDKARGALEAATISGEVVVADNRSADGSVEIAQATVRASSPRRLKVTATLCRRESSRQEVVSS